MFPSLTPEPSRNKPSVKASTSRKPLQYLVRFGFVMILSIVMGGYSWVCVMAEQVYTTPLRTIAVLPTNYTVEYEEVAFPAAYDQLLLRGWLLRAPASPNLVITIHGKDGNRGGVGDDVAEIQAHLVRAGYNVLAFDLRGHGESEGDRFSLGYYEQWDVLGAITFAKEQGFDAEHIALFGFSMGAASALLVLPATDVRVVIADSAFADLPHLLETAFPLPQMFVPGVRLVALLRDGVDLGAVRPRDALSDATFARVFLIHGEQDSLIPVEHLELLVAGGKEHIKELWRVADAGHVEAYHLHREEYIRKILAFLEEQL